MGSANSKTTVSNNLENLKTAMEQGNLTDLAKEIHHELNILENTSLDIAITGMSGVGKSSLVNAFRGMKDDEETSSKTGPVQTTMEPAGYPHPIFPKVTMWDLPGIGTQEFKAKEYVKNMDFQKYDFFIIVAAERFTEHDTELACEIRKMNKKFFYVRTKVDVSIDAESRKANFSEDKTLTEIKNYCCANLKEVGEPSPRVFLISRWDLNMYDFPLLQETLENELNDLKRQALVMALPAYSTETLKKKKALMEHLAWKQALVPCFLGAVELPALSIVCNVVILLDTLKRFYKVFGLDDNSLGRLANWVGKPIDVLRSAIKNTPMDSGITLEWVTTLYCEVLLVTEPRILQMAEENLGFCPRMDSASIEEHSFLITFCLLIIFLNNIEKDAGNVWAKAAECEESQVKA